MIEYRLLAAGVVGGGDGRGNVTAGDEGGQGGTAGSERSCADGTGASPGTGAFAGAVTEAVSSLETVDDMAVVRSCKEGGIPGCCEKINNPKHAQRSRASLLRRSVPVRARAYAEG